MYNLVTITAINEANAKAMTNILNKKPILNARYDFCGGYYIVAVTTTSASLNKKENEQMFKDYVYQELFDSIR